MKTCDYCGKDNEDISTHCAGCGTVLEVPEDTSERPRLPRTLDATNAAIIFLGLFVGAVVAAMIAAMIATGVAAVAELPRSHELRVSLGVLVPLSTLFGGVVMIYLACKLVPNQIRDASPTGAAWIRGPWKAVGKGFAIGLILGLCTKYLSLLDRQYGYYVFHRSLSPWNQMEFVPGWNGIALVVTSVTLAPVVEEMLFRGILYGGFRKSFGREWAAFQVTGLFVILHFLYLILHFQNYMYLPLSAISITAVAVATLWCRLRWGVIGPAIALHAGYNSMVALAAVHWPWR